MADGSGDGPAKQSPVDTLKEYAVSHPREFSVLASAVAVTATIVMIIQYGITPESALSYLVYIFGVAFALAIVTFILNSAVLLQLFAYFFSALFAGWILCSIASSVWPENDALRCIRYVLTDCRTITDRAAKAEAEARPRPGPVPQVLPPPPPGIDPSRFRVFVQFAGAIARDDVRRLMSALGAIGWNVQGADKGGERTPKAAGLSVVRYPDSSSAAAARQLAAEVDKVRLGRPGVGTELNSAVAPGTLEVWISN